MGTDRSVSLVRALISSKIRCRKGSSSAVEWSAYSFSASRCAMTSELDLSRSHFHRVDEHVAVKFPSALHPTGDGGCCRISHERRSSSLRRSASSPRGSCAGPIQSSKRSPEIRS